MRRSFRNMSSARQPEPAWRDNLVFSEYFYGDNGAAIGVDPRARP